MQYNTRPLATRILAEYQASYVKYYLKISSMNLTLTDQPIKDLDWQNPAFLFGDYQLANLWRKF